MKRLVGLSREESAGVQDCVRLGAHASVARVKRAKRFQFPRVCCRTVVARQGCCHGGWQRRCCGCGLCFNEPMRMQMTKGFYCRPRPVRFTCAPRDVAMLPARLPPLLPAGSPTACRGTCLAR